MTYQGVENGIAGPCNWCHTIERKKNNRVLVAAAAAVVKKFLKPNRQLSSCSRVFDLRKT
ncbi:codeine O-demethylase-like protein [Corchorus capsularis]|uniref:Codeine O-demethylase-like protein n=1 Tax=Corchorus capsularis TaxID=210143 RepID=A0A1R3G0Y1_COCAP|nr:codeine O-demethylase-like protein [Corchorus capsularis]